MAALAASAISTASAHAYAPAGSDFRISNASDVADTRDANGSAVAYNPTANQYLVVWSGDGLALTDNEVEIFGQRVSPGGTEVGADFRISNVGTDDDTTRFGAGPAVAYNPAAEEYLVVWQADLPNNDELEIWGQRINSDGTEDGGDFRISNVDTDGNAAQDSTRPSVACCSVADEYLVVWQDRSSAADDLEIYGQRVSANGTEQGGDIQISNASDLTPARAADLPSVAYNAADDEFLAVWRCDCIAPTDNELEIFGQRVNANGTEDGTDFRISNIGLDGDTSRAAHFPALAYNSMTNEYLVAFQADNLPTDDEDEIWGQRVNGDGSEDGTDFRISNVGIDGDASRQGSGAEVAFSSMANEYLVTWVGDGLPTPEEHEIFGQRVSAVGAELGADFRISSVGTDTDDERDAVTGALAYASTPDQYLATWHGDGLSTDEVFEVFGHHLALPAAPITPIVPPAPVPSNSFVVGELDGPKLTLLVNAAGTASVDDAGAQGSGSSAVTAARNLLKPSSAGGGPGELTVVLKLTRKAKRKLREKGKVKVSAQITFTPTGGTASSQTAKLKIKK